MVFWLDYCEITSNDFCFAQRSKNSVCVTENPKKVGDLSRYAGDREKGLKILRLPPNAGELTAMVLIAIFQISIIKQMSIQ